MKSNFCYIKGIFLNLVKSISNRFFDFGFSLFSFYVLFKIGMHLLCTEFGHLPSSMTIKNCHSISIVSLELMHAESILNKRVAFILYSIYSVLDPVSRYFRLIAFTLVHLLLVQEHPEATRCKKWDNQSHKCPQS